MDVCEGVPFEVSTSDPLPEHRLRLLVDGEDWTNLVDLVRLDSRTGRVELCGSEAVVPWSPVWPLTRGT